MKHRITEIHIDDAFYEMRDEFLYKIGEGNLKESRIKGYKAGSLDVIFMRKKPEKVTRITEKGNRITEDGPMKIVPSNEFIYFYAIKTEEIR